MKEKKMIYVVDDSLIIADTLQKLLTSVLPVDAKNFYNGESMLDDFATKVPDLIFLDFYLSGAQARNGKHQVLMNGKHVFEEVRKSYPSIPIVLLTGINNSDTLAEMGALGFDYILRKNQDDLFTHVIDCAEKCLK